MRPDAALTALPDPVLEAARGRPRIRGDRLPTPARMAADGGVPWQQLTVRIYGPVAEVDHKNYTGHWRDRANQPPEARLLVPLRRLPLRSGHPCR